MLSNSFLSGSRYALYRYMLLSYVSWIYVQISFGAAAPRFAAATSVPEFWIASYPRSLLFPLLIPLLVMNIPR